MTVASWQEKLSSFAMLVETMAATSEAVRMVANQNPEADPFKYLAVLLGMRVTEQAILAALQDGGA